VLDDLKITQGSRWYRYWWQGNPPIAQQEIAVHSANMHLIPANPDIKSQLLRTRVGDRIELHGYLVRVDHPSGWRWKSSLSRTDEGGGACEVIYVEEVVRVW